MTTFHVDQNRQATFTVDASQSEWVVGANTIISAGSGAGIYENPNLFANTYQIHGYVGSVGAQGLLLFGDNAKVVVDRSGTLFGGGTDGAYMEGHYSSLTNFGSIYGASGGVVINGYAGAVFNHGVISSHYGVLLYNSGAIKNYDTGVIRGDYAIWAPSKDGVDFPVTQTTNHGLIEGRIYAFLGSGISRDEIINLGSIKGDVALGAGNDTFDTRSGTFDGVVYGQSGNDTFIIGRQSTQIVELDADGYDTVKSTVSVHLPANIEELYLLGAANITGFGNDVSTGLSGSRGDNKLFGGSGAERISGGAGNDTLSGGGGSDELFGGNGVDRLNGGQGADVLNGGKGADKLTGGNGADTFVFQKGEGKDIITDFSDGEDWIVLGMFGIFSTAELKRHLFTSGDDVVFRSGSDSLTFLDVHKSDLSYDDFGPS